MANLTEALTDPAKKSLVVDDCCALIDAEVGDKGGLSGLGIKAGYKVVKGVKPGFVRSVVNELLPEFAAALDPLYQEAKSTNQPVAAHFIKHQGRAADALLAITDAKARHSKSNAVKGAYEGLRGVAKKNVEQAIPRLGKLVEKHAP